MVYEAPRFYMLGASMTAPLLWVFTITVFQNNSRLCSCLRNGGIVYMSIPNLCGRVWSSFENEALLTSICCSVFGSDVVPDEASIPGAPAGSPFFTLGGVFLASILTNAILVGSPQVPPIVASAL